MKYFTVLVCLGAIAALPAEDVMSEKDDMPVKTDLLGLDVPLLHMFRQKIVNAYNATSEFEYWIKHKLHDMGFAFTDDKGNHFNATIEEPTTNDHIMPADVISKVRFHYYNKHNILDISGKKFVSVDELKASNWNPELPVKVLIHGFLNSHRSAAIQLIKDAYLKEGPHNVIGVDWGELAGTDHLGLPKPSLRYDLARNHVPAVGFKVGEMIDELIDANLTDRKNVHIIGHSLGAHVAGIAGKAMVHGSPARITGLDPAGPLFFLTVPDGRLDYSDALLVDVIHTNAFSFGVSKEDNGLFGHPAEAGDIDFYVNGGHRQPQCPIKGVICSHNLAVTYFASSIGSKNEKKYEGFYCRDLPEKVEECKSAQSDQRWINLKAFMGDKVSYLKLGRYYVDYKDLVMPIV